MRLAPFAHRINQEDPPATRQIRYKDDFLTDETLCQQMIPKRAGQQTG
jgi:hypothetical protein